MLNIFVKEIKNYNSVLFFKIWLKLLILIMALKMDLFIIIYVLNYLKYNSWRKLSPKEPINYNNSFIFTIKL
jgi:hypothetical protein